MQSFEDQTKAIALRLLLFFFTNLNEHLIYINSVSIGNIMYASLYYKKKKSFYLILFIILIYPNLLTRSGVFSEKAFIPCELLD